MPKHTPLSPERGSSHKKKSRNLRTWIPQYHGGWAMVAAPPIIGMIGTWYPSQLLLFALWFIGYFLFYSATVWLRSRMKRRYLPPVIAYGVAVGVLGLAMLWVAPFLLWWALIYAPLMGFAAGAAWRRDERSLASGFDTVVAACLLIPMMYDVGAGTFWVTPVGAWLHTASVFGYFAGTVLYVKTNIRERKSTGYFAASVAWHTAWVMAVTAMAVHGIVGWSHVTVWAIIAARSCLVPAHARRTGKGVSVKAIGIGEVITCIAFAATLIVAIQAV